MTPSIQIRTLTSVPFEENCYVLWQPGRGDGVVVDPGLEPDIILNFLRDEGLIPSAILNTHGHADHIAGNEAMKRHFPDAPLIIGANDAPLLTNAELNLSAPFGFEIISPGADRTVKEGDLVETAGMRFEVYDVPGHSPGHVVFVLRGSPVMVLGGDVLFREGVGRTDFPGGSSRLLFDGIRGKLYTLPADAVVYPGHGPVTTVGHEMRHNPFVAG